MHEEPGREAFRSREPRSGWAPLDLFPPCSTTTAPVTGEMQCEWNYNKRAIREGYVRV